MPVKRSLPSLRGSVIGLLAPVLCMVGYLSSPDAPSLMAFPQESSLSRAMASVCASRLATRFGLDGWEVCAGSSSRGGHRRSSPVPGPDSAWQLLRGR